MALNKKIIAGTVCCALTAIALTGCGSGGHQVISSNHDCSTCHSSEKPRYELDAPTAGTFVTCAPGTQVNVTTNGETAVLCRVIFTAEDGSKFVPVMSATLGTSDTSFEAKEGLWAVVADEGDGSHGTVLVVEPGADSAEVNIEL